jgi:hypothetical protein
MQAAGPEMSCPASMSACHLAAGPFFGGWATAPSTPNQAQDRDDNMKAPWQFRMVWTVCSPSPRSGDFGGSWALLSQDDSKRATKPDLVEVA